MSVTKSTKRRCTATIPSRVPADVEPPLSVAVIARRRLRSREVSNTLAACQSGRALSDHWARNGLRRSCPPQKNQKGEPDRSETPTQPIRGGKWTEIETVRANPL